MKKYELNEQEIKKTLDALYSPHPYDPLGQTPYYDISQKIEFKIQILIDDTLQTARFKPHPEQAHIWYANALTAKAINKDLFLLGETHDEGGHDLEKAQCRNCQSFWEKFYWHCCPQCGDQFYV